MLPLRCVRRLANVVVLVALGTYGGPLACDENPFGPSLDGYVEPTSPLTVEVRTVDGAGIAGVPVEVQGTEAGGDAATVYAKATTGADGTVYIGQLSIFLGARAYRLLFTTPSGYGLAPGQESPMNFSLTGEASNGAPGSGLYGKPARVIVRLVRVP